MPSSLIELVRTRRVHEESRDVVSNVSINDFLREDPINWWVPVKFDIVRIEHLLREVSRKDNPLIYDLGCGYGLVSYLLSLSGCNVVGVDSDDAKVTNAREMFRNDRLDFITHNVSNIASLNYTPDAVYCGWMPTDEDWTDYIHRLNPKMIIHALAPSMTGGENTYNANHAYRNLLAWPIISRADLHWWMQEYHRTCKLVPDCMRGSIVVQLRRDIAYSCGEDPKISDTKLRDFNWERQILNLMGIDC